MGSAGFQLESRALSFGFLLSLLRLSLHAFGPIVSHMGRASPAVPYFCPTTQALPRIRASVLGELFLVGLSLAWLAVGLIPGPITVAGRCCAFIGQTWVTLGGGVSPTGIKWF